MLLDIIYLEKLLFVLDCFTADFGNEKPKAGHTWGYKVYENAEIRGNALTIWRNGNGKMVSIVDVGRRVEIYNSDGSYNLDGLERLFKQMNFSPWVTRDKKL